MKTPTIAQLKARLAAGEVLLLEHPIDLPPLNPFPSRMPVVNNCAAISKARLNRGRKEVLTNAGWVSVKPGYIIGVGPSGHLDIITD